MKTGIINRNGSSYWAEIKKEKLFGNDKFWIRLHSAETNTPLVAGYSDISDPFMGTINKWIDQIKKP